jgi:hypothetical protein
VAAGEDQPQPVVGHRRLRFGVELLGAGRQRLEALEHLLLHTQGLLAAEAIDRLVARHPGYPGAGVVRDAVARPALERDDEGFLDRLLGGVEVTQDADQARDRPSRLVAEQAVDDLIGTGVYDAAV